MFRRQSAAMLAGDVFGQAEIEWLLPAIAHRFAKTNTGRPGLTCRAPRAESPATRAAELASGAADPHITTATAPGTSVCPNTDRTPQAQPARVSSASSDGERAWCNRDWRRGQGRAGVYCS
jgi:hypothetical protein